MKLIDVEVFLKKFLYEVCGCTDNIARFGYLRGIKREQRHKYNIQDVVSSNNTCIGILSPVIIIQKCNNSFNFVILFTLSLYKLYVTKPRRPLNKYIE